MASTQVQLFILPPNHGDQLALDAIKAMRRNMDKTTTAPTIFLPAILDVILQQVSAAYPLTNTSEAVAIVEKAITVGKAAVVHGYGK